MTALSALVAAALGQEPPRDERLVIEHLGYIDVGLFDAAGDGVAYDRDRPAFHEGLDPATDPGLLPDPATIVPPGAQVAWVFFGDPWANAVNSQGESADLGNDRNPIQRADTIASGGRPTALVNRVHYGLLVDRGEDFGLRIRMNLDPRQGALGTPGDLFSLDVAYALWRPDATRDVTVYVGRIESGFGAEYTYRRAPIRTGVTPSLMARYTVGRQTGVRVRGTARRWFDYSASLTTGSTVDEGFGHFADDVDRNGAPTLTARLGAHRDGIVRVSGGLSGEVGARDAQPDPGLLGWQVGADGTLEVRDLTLRAEALVVHLPPGAAGHEELLFARGGQLEGALQASNHVAPYLRVDWRDADLFVEHNLYVSNVVRTTVGCRMDLDPHTILKAEVLHLVELEGQPIRDDVVTSSLVFRF